MSTSSNHEARIAALEQRLARLEESLAYSQKSAAENGQKLAALNAAWCGQQAHLMKSGHRDLTTTEQIY